MDGLEKIKQALADVNETPSMDSGGGMGSRDFWVRSGGVEWLVTVQKSGAQIEKELRAAQH